MGLLDMFKKKEKNVAQNMIVEQPKSPYTIKQRINSDGKLQIDFTDKNADFKQFYDTTRLIIEGKTVGVNGNKIEKALISWYNESDAIMFGKNGEEISSRTQYEEILLGVDVNLIQNDDEYCTYVMKNLLNKKRVREYLQIGMQENPQIPCGNYVGEVVQTEGKYKKRFIETVGHAVHNSSSMKQKRYEYTKQIEERNLKSIREKSEQISKLKKEVEDIKGSSR